MNPTAGDANPPPPGRSSIRRKVARLVLALVVVATGVSAGGLFILQRMSFQRRAERELETLAGLIGKGVNAEVRFNSAEEAERTLAAVRRDARLAEVHILSLGDLQRFASAPPDAVPPQNLVARGPGFHRDQTGLWLIRELKDDQDRSFALVALCSPLAELGQEERRAVVLLAGTTLLVLGLAGWLAGKLNRSLTRPILALASAVQEIEARQNPSLRAPVVGDDELGDLAIRINRMLDSLAANARQLAESEARLQSIFRTAPMPIVVTDRQRKVLSVNAQTCQLFGYTVEELVGTSVAPRFADAEEARRVGLVLEQQLTGTAILSIPTRLLHRDGTVIEALVVASNLNPERPEGGRIGCVVDLTDIRRKEAQLRQSEAVHRAIFEESPLPMALSQAGKFTDVNRPFCELVGRSRDELVGQDPLSGKAGDSEAARLSQAATAAGGRLDNFPVTRLKDGQEQHLLVNTRALVVAGQPSILAAILDITKRRQAEDEIRRLNEELEARVQRRTEELAAANQELEAFCYSVSHDLRQPLRAVDGFSNALLADHSPQLDEQAKFYLSRIRAATQRMGQLIDDLLRLSRTSRATMKITQVDLSALAEKTVASLRDSQPARTVEVHIQPGMTALADPGLMAVVLQNLLDNAWKFTGQTAAARIEFRATAEPGGTVYEVADNGAGFDMAYAGKLFGVFQRLHDSREFPGTGIGLATVYRVVRRHGGRIWAEGRVGHGARICFTLAESSPAFPGNLPEVGS